MTRRLLALLAAFALSLSGCKSPEQKLVERRRDLRAKLDALYAEYARGASPPEPGADPGLLGRVAGEMGRAYFEHSCLALGRGERPITLSARLDAFLADERNAGACRKAADLELEVHELERQVPAGSQDGDRERTR
jgi:hypothetical protein